MIRKVLNEVWSIQSRLACSSSHHCKFSCHAFCRGSTRETDGCCIHYTQIGGVHPKERPQKVHRLAERIDPPPKKTTLREAGVAVAYTCDVYDAAPILTSTPTLTVTATLTQTRREAGVAVACTCDVAAAPTLTVTLTVTQTRRKAGVAVAYTCDAAAALTLTQTLTQTRREAGVAVAYTCDVYDAAPILTPAPTLTATLTQTRREAGIAVAYTCDAAAALAQHFEHGLHLIGP